MARYIDAENLIRHLEENIEEHDNPDAYAHPIAYGSVLGLRCALSYAETLPTADVVEIDDNLEIVIMSAVRYAIGRRTYVPSIVIGFTIPLLNKLSVSTLLLLERDICDADSYGDEKIDKPDWMMFLQKIREEKKRRANDTTH